MAPLEIKGMNHLYRVAPWRNAGPRVMVETEGLEPPTRCV